MAQGTPLPARARAHMVKNKELTDLDLNYDFAIPSVWPMNASFLHTVCLYEGLWKLSFFLQVLMEL